MTTALTFNEVTLSPVNHNNSLWIRATELARALGYSDESKVSRIYRAHAEEFTPDMVQPLEIAPEAQNGLPGKARIFSPRGCHLIAMFARTAVAKAFRRWVLDVLDKFAKTEHQPEALSDSITPDQQCTLQALVKAKVEALPEAQRKGRGLYPQIWSRFNNHFRLARYCQLPQCRMSEAVAYLTQMDVTPAKNALPLSRPLPRPALPQARVAVPSCNKELRAAADIAEAIRLVENIRERVRREHWPREFRCGDKRDEARYELQWDMFRACNAGLKAAAAALCASVEVSDWA